MATYAIGDIHGCYRTLQRLLERVDFDRSRDTVWLVGDLVNRGRESLAVLRWAKELGERCVCVLGNHDLFLLAKVCGEGRDRPNDTLRPILSAPDRRDLIEWLRHRPLLHTTEEHVLVHAGLHPYWSLDDALQYAEEAERAIQSEGFGKLLSTIRLNNSIVWNGFLSGQVRTKVIINVLTRMRICTDDGQLSFKFCGPANRCPKGYRPWYKVPRRKPRHRTILFGHWSALGYLEDNGVICLDGGCVYRGELVAYRLEDGAVFRQKCAEK